MRLTRVLALASLALFATSCANTPAARTCGVIGGLLGGGGGYYGGNEAAGVEGGAAGAVVGGVLVGTAAYYLCNAWAAEDPDDLPPPSPRSSSEPSVPAYSPRMPDPVGDIPDMPPPPPPLAPEPPAPNAPKASDTPPMPQPPPPVAPPMRKLPPAIAPVPEPPPPPPPEPTPPPPIEPPPPPPPVDPVKEKIVLRGVNFDFDRAEIRSDAAVILDEAAAILGRNPDRQVVIEGHTDWTGPEEYNQTLSEARAEAVKKFLVENGIEATNLSTVGFGESMPVAPNDTRDGRDRNRRVELKVLE